MLCVPVGLPGIHTQTQPCMQHTSFTWGKSTLSSFDEHRLHNTWQQETVLYWRFQSTNDTVHRLYIQMISYHVCSSFCYCSFSL